MRSAFLAHRVFLHFVILIGEEYKLRTLFLWNVLKHSPFFLSHTVAPDWIASRSSVSPIMPSPLTHRQLPDLYKGLRMPQRHSLWRWQLLSLSKRWKTFKILRGLVPKAKLCITHNVFTCLASRPGFALFVGLLMILFHLLRLLLNSRMICEWWIRKDVEGSDRGLFCGTNPLFVWSDEVKPKHL